MFRLGRSATRGDRHEVSSRVALAHALILIAARRAQAHENKHKLCGNCLTGCAGTVSVTVLLEVGCLPRLFEEARRKNCLRGMA